MALQIPLGKHRNSVVIQLFSESDYKCGTALSIIRLFSFSCFVIKAAFGYLSGTVAGI